MGLYYSEHLFLRAQKLHLKAIEGLFRLSVSSLHLSLFRLVFRDKISLRLSWNSRLGQTGLELRPASLCLPGAGIKVVPHHCPALSVISSGKAIE